jgi:hypothetical protein
MATNVVLTDGLPKDAGGQKFAAWADISTSVLDFVLPKGIGGSIPFTGVGHKVGHLAIGTHTQNSAIEPLHPLVVTGGVYIQSTAASPATCAVAPGSAQMVVMSNWGEMGARALPLTGSQVSTSANLVKNSSGIVYKFWLSLSGGSAGDVCRLRDSTGDKLTIIAEGRFGTWEAPLPAGGVVFDTNIQHAMTTTGTVGEGASAFVAFR